MAKKSTKKTKLGFVCPDCGRTDLHSVEEVVVKFPVVSVDKDGDIEYNLTAERREGGEVLFFQCPDCGYMLENDSGEKITTGEQLRKWLKDHKE